MQYDKDKIIVNLREHLKKFSLYKESHSVSVYLFKSGLYISYCDSHSSQQKKYFDLEINDDNCHIISPYIETENGYSNSLAEIIESFCCEELNCKRFITTPDIKLKRSGFWSKRGFKYMNAIVLEKSMQD